MAQKKFSELEAGAVDGTSIFAQTKTENGSLVSKGATASALAGYIGTSHQFAGLNTDAKDIIGAVNEAAQSGGGASVIQLTQAEYTALSTAEKMNGSIYKLTDKAVMYCLDEEYHALKELTSAQYEALTTAEQNNGTLYIKTDAETTASDIPMSSSGSTTVAEAIDKIGQLYSAAWSASSTSASYTRLTNSLALGKKGLYLITLIIPNSDANVYIGFRVEGWGVVQKYTQLGSLGSFTFPFEAIYDNLSIYFDSQQSGAVNFSYLERGGLFAVRIK